MPTTQAAPSTLPRWLAAALQSRGLDEADYEVRDVHGEAPVETGELLSIRCISSGIERSYSVGANTAWLDSLLADVNADDFIRPGSRAAS
jgi:hypothetical protein